MSLRSTNGAAEPGLRSVLKGQAFLPGDKGEALAQLEQEGLELVGELAPQGLVQER